MVNLLLPFTCYVESVSQTGVCLLQVEYTDGLRADSEFRASVRLGLVPPVASVLESLVLITVSS